MFSLFGKTESSLLDRLKKSVSKTRSEIAARVEGLFGGGRRLDEEQLKRLENALLAADLGVRTTRELLDAVRNAPADASLRDPAQLRGALKQQLLEILRAAPATPNGSAPDHRPHVIFVVGVNQQDHHQEARPPAAPRQRSYCFVKRHLSRRRRRATGHLGRAHGAEIIKQKPALTGTVVYDGLTALAAWTPSSWTPPAACTQSNLMAELDKMKRTAAKLVPGAPHDVLLVLDATTGQNGLAQAREFTAAAGVTGIVLTKLDGTARGGIVVPIVRELGLPVRFVGTGETADDLVPFDAQTFVNSLFD
jgi:fused signal recognition particle receptor